MAEFTQFLCVRRPDFLLETSQFFRAILAQNLRDPDAGRLIFSNLDAILTRSTLSDVVQYAQRTLAECMHFLCAGRAGFPEILQYVRPIFAQILRDLDAGLARNLALERISIQKKSCNEVLRFVQPCWPSSRNFCTRGRQKIFRDFAILSLEFCLKFA